MATRRRRRGYIEPLPSNRFRAVVYAGVDPLTGKRRNLTETAPTYDQAEIALTKLLRKVDEQQHPKSAITVREAIAQWLEVVDLEVSTGERYEDLIRLYIDPRVGDLQAGGWTPSSSSGSTPGCSAAVSCATDARRRRTSADR